MDAPTPRPSHATGATSPPLLDATIGDQLDATAAAYPSHEALVDVPRGLRWTYAQLVRDVDQVARGLLARDVGVGDRVGVWAPNCAEWTLVQLATAKVGAILVNINPAYRTHELAYVVQQSGISVLVVAESFKSSDYPAMVEEVRAGCDTLRDVVVFGQDSWDELLQAAERVSAEELAKV
jgi:fatty-acyl-CoA synthase